ncbi:hypothetical protein EA772_01340 [Pedobacter sp. G11]|uniref:hypothetical protein n=1 Tax=Pedobacter sp. G11 TaxID=2482728 RepID=UPI000F5E6506|nr:hypothetical protein [Pedobacter sp. G11]AZI24052.1 hypothetical protein EA772_01340 [Pedobacter sp. G11]
MKKICLKFLVLIGISIVSRAYSQNKLDPNGNVGIGTSNPITRFQVQKESSAPAIMIGGGFPGSPRLQIYGLGEDSNAWMGLGVDMSGNSYEHSIYFPKSPLGYSGRLTIGDYNGNIFNTRMTVLDNGNVGIGILNPQSLLHVNGKTIINDNLKILGKDAAWAEGLLIVKPSGWSGIRLARHDPSTNNFEGNWALGYNATSGNDFSISNVRDGNQMDYVFHISAQTRNVGIGTSTPNEKLAVNGNIRAKEIKVETTNWPDYVFDEGYKIEKLGTLESYIKTNKHLPEMPSAKEVESEGVELGDIIKRLLKNQEELTLHLIEKNKEIINLEKRLSDLERKGKL